MNDVKKINPDESYFVNFSCVFTRLYYSTWKFYSLPGLVFYQLKWLMPSASQYLLLVLYKSYVSLFVQKPGL